jgi:hypothetical protein
MYCSRIVGNDAEMTRGCPPELISVITGNGDADVYFGR